jgi:phytoene desaturase
VTFPYVAGAVAGVQLVTGIVLGAYPVVTSSVVIVGAGLGGLASAALLAKAGMQVTVVEKNSWVGGKSRRIHVEGQRIDTGPSLVTFPGVLERFFDRYDLWALAASQRDCGLTLERLPEVGRYFYRGDVTDLPVAPDHPWHDAWQAFESRTRPTGCSHHRPSHHRPVG